MLGTTGHPKGVLLTHRATMQQIEMVHFANFLQNEVVMLLTGNLFDLYICDLTVRAAVRGETPVLCHLRHSALPCDIVSPPIP